MEFGIFFYRNFHCIAGVAQLVERQPSKLNVAGSNPVSRSKSSFKTENYSLYFNFQIKARRRARSLC